MHLNKQNIIQLLPLSQVPPYPASVPSGQIHATLLTDVCVSVTTHCWDGEHGLLTTQGFKQVSLMQVSCGGQSLSTRHSGSSDTTAEKTCSLRVRVLQGPNLLPLTLNTRYMAISNQRISAGANLSVISGTTFSTLSTVAWSAKRLTFFSGETTARNKVTFFSGSTIRIATTACLNACNKRIALKAWRTNTDGSVKVHFTLSSGTTDGGQARVNTLLRLASFV